MTDYRALALECGFDVAEPLDPATLVFSPEVRAMCAADRCRSYGKSWACPPACGELEHWRERAARYNRGLILQSIGEREDSYDYEAMMEAAAACDKCFQRLAGALAGQDVLAMSAGTCTRCEKCTYPDAPCRFPESLYPSMEACGLFVSQVCRDNNVAYYYGEDRIAFTCCLLFNE